jgi:hypothetical protein
MSSTTQQIAPSSAAAPPPPPRRTGRWLAGAVVLLVLAAVGITVAAIAFGVRVAESLRQETATETVPGVRELVVKTDEGSVSMRRADGTGVGIRTTEVWSGDSRPAPERHLDAGVLTLSSDCPALNIGCEVNYKIAVPDGTVVRVETVDGSVDAEGLVSPRFEASTVDGSIHLTVPPGNYRVKATTIDGRVRVGVPDDPSASKEISVHSVDGGIDILPG